MAEVQLYPNGEIPYSKLIIFGRGKYPDGKEWVWALSPGTYAKHLALVARVKAARGRELKPGPGSSYYRDLAEQVRARAIYGNGAARPGTSSHGGYWEGMNTLAIDYSNWEYVYGGDTPTTRKAFGADCLAVGLSPFLISTARGYPDEPWHVIDKNPWRAMPAGGWEIPFPEEDDMSAQAESQINAIFNAIFRGGESMDDDKKSIDQSIAEIHDKLDDVRNWTAPVSRGGALIPLRQEVADAKTNTITLLERPPVTLTEADYDAIAKRVVELISQQPAPAPAPLTLVLTGTATPKE